LLTSAIEKSLDDELFFYLEYNTDKPKVCVIHIIQAYFVLNASSFEGLAGTSPNGEISQDTLAKMH
jgi:hypothetical protein